MNFNRTEPNRTKRMESDEKENATPTVHVVEGIEVADENTLYVLQVTSGLSFALRRREINDVYTRENAAKDDTHDVFVTNWMGREVLVGRRVRKEDRGHIGAQIVAFKVRGATTYEGKRFVFPALCDTRSVFDVPGVPGCVVS